MSTPPFLREAVDGHDVFCWHHLRERLRRGKGGTASALPLSERPFSSAKWTALTRQTEAATPARAYAARSDRARRVKNRAACATQRACMRSVSERVGTTCC